MQQVVEQLGLGAKMPARKGGPGQPGPAQQLPAPGGRFVLPISECEFTVNAALDELQRNAFPTISEQRPSRCTGTALQVGRPRGLGFLGFGPRAGRVIQDGHPCWVPHVCFSTTGLPWKRASAGLPRCTLQACKAVGRSPLVAAAFTGCWHGMWQSLLSELRHV